uniref:Uncharacterized protein n=1 Tax=Brassica oleracea TaxID=3712 RepID=A0A3P6E4B6_BRAOL|nr:unnamed protein product [Brassica oleracea]
MICFLCIRGTSRLCLYLYFSFTTCVSVNFHLVSPSLKDNSKDGRFPLSSASRRLRVEVDLVGSCYGSWWLVSWIYLLGPYAERWLYFPLVVHPGVSMALTNGWSGS